MIEIVTGLESLHSQNLTHNDISANNILMRNNYSLCLSLYFNFFLTYYFFE
jgi:serine/threonine protein kinase